MRFLASPALLLIAAAPATNPAPAGMKPVCRNPAMTRVARHAPAPGIHPLGQEPPAQGFYAVLRTVDGCNTPMKVSERIAPKR